MASLASALIIQGYLILSPSNPLTLSSTQQTLWFSQPKVVILRQGSTKSFLEVQNLGSVHIVGLGSAQKVSKVLTVSDQNYLALKNCKQSPFEIRGKEVVWNSHLEHPDLLKCGFERLRLSMPHKWEAKFAQAESKLIKSGYLIRGGGWENGQRIIQVIANNKNSESSIFDDLREQLGGIAAFYNISIRNTPNPGNTLLFDLTLFEFSRDRAAALGLRWPTEFQIGTLEGPKLSFSQLSNSEGIMADFGQSQGVGKIIARPRILSNPGEKARFQSGGELPIRQSSAYSQNTQWKNYGLILELTSDKETKAGDQEVLVSFNLEVSEPDEATSIEGVPGMLKRSLESRFALLVDRTTVLSSLQKIRSGRDQNGIWAFSQLPIFGYLFSNQHHRNSETELWFAIKPSWSSLEEEDTQNKKYDVKF